ncbi:ATP-binding protein [Aquimarina sp. 2201CG5-10]|uniref:ATP-binding protein n=1 Tax=Aquimarina callyspongiae TaxID=3098150 RepID=UPI002AB53721|nr:transporter substrate-binding domain-containing protein [Aquimarina sp. 2201CG5-10]MDY8137332.1 transporter substrate-binding domain-containing protein [Aquimarina sp. 2201CG5-10]
MFKKLPYYFLLIIQLVFLSACSQSHTIEEEEKNWLQENDDITVALFPYYPPYQFINDQGNIDGIFIEYLELIEKKIDHKFKKKQYSNWIQLLEDKKANKVDIILEIQQTEKRDSYLNFYAQLFQSPHIIVSNKKKDNPTKLKDLSGKIVTVPNEYAIYENLKKQYPNLNIKVEIDELTCLKKVNSGEYDAYIGPRAVANYFIKAENLSNLRMGSKTKFKYEPSIAVTKENAMLNAIIEKATKSITSKEKQSIINNWLYNVVQPFYKKPVFWIILSGIIFLILSFILLLNVYLKYKVKEKTRELVIAKENAEESDRLKTNFIRNISHEIRTPMNGIVGFSEFLNNPDLTAEESKEYTRIIINSGKQLMSIIEDILEISRLRTKQIKVNVEKTNLIILFQTLNSIFIMKAQEKGVSLQLDNRLPDDQKLVLIDKSKLHKILSNLLSNAIKFTNEGSVTMTCKIKEELLVISIEDTGIGINPRDQELIFKSFSQSEKEISKNYGGLGLGLTIAKENATLIGGHISFKSILDQGTTFTVTLPHNPIQSNIVRTSSKFKNKLPESEKHIILIAEDGDVNFLFLKTILIKMTDYEFVVHRAKDGKEAVSLCENNLNIDLVLMDIKMPVMNGYDATKHIKRMRPGLPVIAQTAYSTEEDIQRALDAGCDDFISKPVDRNILKPILKKYFFSKQRQSNP